MHGETLKHCMCSKRQEPPIQRYTVTYQKNLVYIHTAVVALNLQKFLCHGYGEGLLRIL